MRAPSLSATLLCCSALLCCSVLVSVSARASSSGFNPRDYEKHSVDCKAVKRDAKGELVDITLSESSTSISRSLNLLTFRSSGYVDINPSANTTLIMLHGWPSLWSTWSNQIQEFKVCCVGRGTIRFLTLRRTTTT